MATIVNNEGRWMPEWVLFHRLLGFDHFYLGWATLHASVPSLQRDLNIRVPAHVYFTPQFVIVQHAARTYAHETEWLAFFDIDVFVLPKSAETWCVGAYLAGRPKGQGVLRLQGNLFLPNATDHRKLPRSRLLIDTAKFLVPLGKNKERCRTMADFEVKKHKTYAGHVGKARVFERLTAALNGYLKQDVEIHPSHPIHRYQPAVRGFYATFQAWYEHPPPRPQLAIPAAFGRAEIAERIPSSA
ncbi:hypothetical protein T492DRAFT_899099 [Pavlovales sp. CCMP2436]|nr:hypothetical protein T492DRAFT_899099 [Pavlovales sp. CCMP2436]